MNIDLQSLIEENRNLREMNLQLQKQVIELTDELKRIKNQSSKNSSKPPSLDNKKNLEGPKNKGGAKTGHPGHLRRLIPEESVDLVKHLVCSSCPTCQTSHIKVKKSKSLFQYVDLVKHRIFVTNFIRENYYCPSCRKKFIAPLPSEIGNSPFGPRLQALVSVLTGRYHLSKKDVPSLIYDIYRFKMSSGVVSKIEARMGSALKPVSERIKTDIHSNSECTYADETTWRHAGKNCFVWQMSTETLTLCEIHFHRNKEARDHILGRHFIKPLVTDRYVVYRSLNLPHQYCLAHLLRNFQSFAEGKLPTRVIGTKLCKELAAVFCQWRLYQQEQISWSQLKSRCFYRRQKLKEWLISGYLTDNKRLSSFCKSILQDYDCLWTFLRVAGMEPTNNLAERDLRPTVLWRKKSFGTKGLTGLEFVSRITSVIQSLKKQGRSLINFLTDVLSGHHPSIVPS